MKTHHKIKTLFILIALFAALSANAASWYVDPNASGPTHDGTTWTKAWTTLTAITGISAGDTVYISGNSSGSSQTYHIDTWSPVGGTAGHPITYQIGQDSAHNGTAVFDTSGGSNPGLFVVPANNLVILGDAGDGNMHFSATHVNTVMYWGSASTLSNFRLGYINFGTVTSNGKNPEDVMFAYPGGVIGFEFDHNYVNMTSPTAWSFAYLIINNTTWDGTKIHDNTIYALHNYTDGPDIFETGGSSGFSIYGNSVYSTYSSDVSSDYDTSQHQDFWQDTGGSSYIKIYDNYMANMGNSCIFAEGDNAGFSHLRIYNNIGEMTASVASGWVPQGITVAPTGSGTKTFTDVQVMNNLMADMSGGEGLRVSASGYSDSATFTSCNVYNNTVINCATADIGSGVSAGDNVALTLSANNGSFVAYHPASTGNDYHLVPCETTFTDQGANESAYFTTDKDGLPRPATGAWDIGPYEHVIPAIGISANSYPPFLYNNTGSSLSFTVTASPAFTCATEVWLLIGDQQGTDNSWDYAYWHSSPPTDFTVSGCTPEVFSGLFYVNFGAGDTTKTVTLTGTGSADPGDADNGYLELILTLTLTGSGYSAGSSPQINASLYP